MLRLRPYKRSDAASIITWVANQDAHSAWCADLLAWPLDQAAFDAYQEETDKKEDCWLLTALDRAGSPVGFLTMKRADYDQNSVHLATIIIASDRRGQGLGEEMLRLTLRYAREILGVSRVTLRVFDHNASARACYEKAGFRNVDYALHCFHHGGQLWSCWTMAAE